MGLHLDWLLSQQLSSESLFISRRPKWLVATKRQGQFADWNTQSTVWCPDCERGRVFFDHLGWRHLEIIGGSLGQNATHFFNYSNIWPSANEGKTLSYKSEKTCWKTQQTWLAVDSIYEHFLGEWSEANLQSHWLWVYFGLAIKMHNTSLHLTPIWEALKCCSRQAS